MQFMKRLFFAVTTMALLATLTTLLAPKAVHALVATLIRDIDNPARATLVVADCSAIGGVLACTPAYAVPAGDRLVIQQLEAVCVAFQGQSVPNTFLSMSTNGTPTAHGFPLVNEGLDSMGFQRFGNNQAVTYYADPGSTVTFSSQPTDPTTGCSYSLTGYLVSYP